MTERCMKDVLEYLEVTSNNELFDEEENGQSSEEEFQSSRTSLEQEISAKEVEKCHQNRPLKREGSWLRVKSGCTIKFVVNSTVVSTSLLLVQLVLRENGASSEQLDPFINFSWLWILSLVGGYLTRLMHLPSLLGMLSAGIISSNLFDIHIPEGWRTICTSAGLAIILLRSGLELDLESIKRSSMVTMRLTLIPGCVEALVCGMSAMYLFDMPFWLALSLGFILAAVSPAVVVSGMLELQNNGYGIKKGIPSLVIASASLDDIFAISGFSICIALAIKDKDTSILHAALHGPVSIIMGIILGFATGSIMSLTKLWNSAEKRSLLMILIALTLMFGMRFLSYPGSGAMGALIFGVVSSCIWHKEGQCQEEGDTEENDDNGQNVAIAEKTPKPIQNVEHNISTVWEMIFEPLLFGCIGSALNFNLIASNTVTKSIAIVSLGSLVRLSAAFFAVSGNHLSNRERLFISLAWLPKATVQAALCSFPLQLVKETLPQTANSYNAYLEWGEQILSTAILSICITAPLGVLSIKFFGKRWLERSAMMLDDLQKGKVAI